MQPHIQMQVEGRDVISLSIHLLNTQNYNGQGKSDAMQRLAHLFQVTVNGHTIGTVADSRRQRNKSVNNKGKLVFGVYCIILHSIVVYFNQL